MRLPRKLRRRAADSRGTQDPPEPETHEPLSSAADPLTTDPLTGDASTRLQNEDTSRPRKGPLRRLLRRESKEAGEPSAEYHLARERGTLDEDAVGQSLQTDDGIHEMLSSAAATATEEQASGMLDEPEQIYASGGAERPEAEPIRFDSRPTTIFEPIFRYLLVLGLVLVVVAAILAINALRHVGTSDEEAGSQAGAGAAVAANSTAPEGRAAQLAEEFARAYMAYPSSEDGAVDDYMADLQPYLHPMADPALFEPEVGEDATGSEVGYASARSVEEAPGSQRYRVVVDTRLAAADSDAASEEQKSTARSLAITVKVPPQGSAAYVLAPPRVSEAPASQDAGQPGIYGYPGAQGLEESGMAPIVEDFLEAAYGPPDERALVQEQLANGASVASFPPEEHTYEGMERAAVYYRDRPEQAEARGYSSLYDIEVYVAVTDEDSGRRQLDSWALTVGEHDKGGFEITSVS